MSVHYPKPTSCTGCPLYEAPGPVFGEGDTRRARLIYIAQNPGTEEVRATPMRPLVGASGRIFNRQLTEAGIRREELYITNQVKCLTPGNREPTGLEIKHCAHFVTEELARCSADTVILSGALAFRQHLEGYSTLNAHYHPTGTRGRPSGLFDRMGCVEQKEGRKYVATIHPAFVMRMPMFRLAAIDHLRKAYAIAGSVVPLPRVIERPSADDVERHKGAARQHALFADDVESQFIPKDAEEDDYVGADYEIDLVGFSAVEYESIVLDASDAGVWADVWADPSITVAEHNGEYDQFHLGRPRGLDDRPERWPQRNERFDTMQAHHFLHNNERQALKPYCLSRYTNLPYYNRGLEVFSRRLYAGMDNVATLLIAKRQRALLKEQGLWDLIHEIGFPLLPLLEEQRVVGARVDIKRALLLRRIAGAKYEQANKLIEQMLGPLFNPRSPKQVAELFYGKWGLPPVKIKDSNTHKERVTTGDTARTKLAKWIDATPARQQKHRQASIYFKLAEVAAGQKKLIEYVDRISPDYRVHAHWKDGTDTFRLASTPNFQNWPTWGILPGLRRDDPTNFSVRSIIIPDHDDDLFLMTDWDQIELWTYAKHFDIKWLLEVYNSGDYIYGKAYEDAFRRPFFKPGHPRIKKFRDPSVSDEDLLRAKAIPLGFLYGRAGESVAAEHGWAPADGRKYREDWYRLNPELPRAHAWIEWRMQQRGELRPPPGLLMHFPQATLAGLNAFGQAPAAAMLRSSMILIDREFKRRALKGTRIVLSVHDSLLINVRDARANPLRLVEVYEEVVSPIISRPVPWLDGFRYKHEAKVGTQWDWDTQAYDEWKEAPRWTQALGDPQLSLISKSTL